MFTFDFGPSWLFPKFNYWFASWWHCLYSQKQKSWFFPFDQTWYYPHQDFYVRLFKDKSPYFTIKNDGDSTLFFAIYHKENKHSNAEFVQIKTPQSIKSSNKSQLFVKDHDHGEIVLISRNQHTLKQRLDGNEAQEIAAVCIDTCKGGIRSAGNAPHNALRIDALDAEMKMRLRNAGMEIERKNVGHVVED